MQSATNAAIAFASMIGLAACQGGGAQVASMAAGLDPTGIASMAVGAAISAEAQSKPQPEMKFAAAPDYTGLERMAPRLEDVAAGNTARPRMSNPADGQLAAGQGMLAAGIAQNVAAGAMSGGLGLAASAPTAIWAGVGLAQMTAGRASVNATFAQLEAERDAKRIVPDEDRPAEAQAILTLLDAPAGKSATWENPATGSSGKVTIGAPKASSERVTCRPVKQEWRRGGETRRREIGVCNQQGVWFDMS